MRVILVGAPSDRARLRSGLPSGAFDVIGEAVTMRAARALDLDPDAFVVAPAAPGSVLAFADADDEPVAIESLTPREIEVLLLLSEGLPNKAIADRLDISDQTVKFHVASIYGKLGAANRTDAVRRAVRRGLIDL